MFGCTCDPFLCLCASLDCWISPGGKPRPFSIHFGTPVPFGLLFSVLSPHECTFWHTTAPTPLGIHFVLVHHVTPCFTDAQVSWAPFQGCPRALEVSFVASPTPGTVFGCALDFSLCLLRFCLIRHSWTSGCAYLGTPDLSLRLLGQFGPLSASFGVLLPTLCAILGALSSSDCLWTPPRALGMPFGVSGTLGAYFSTHQCNLFLFSVCLSVHLNPLGVPLGHPGCLHFFVRVFQDPV